MDTLPPEILAEITDHVYDIDSICKMRQVCRSLENGVANSKRWRGLHQLKELKSNFNSSQIKNKCLELAAEYGILILLRANPKVLYPCKYFRIACENDHLETVKYLRKEFGLTTDDARNQDNYALRWACANGHLKIVRYLKKEFGLTAKDVRAGDNYALRWSCRNNHLSIVKYLKEKFSLTAKDARASNNFGLRWACENCHLNVVKYLREGFGLTTEDATRTLGHYACRWIGEDNYLGIVNYLIEEFNLICLRDIEIDLWTN